MNLAVVAFTLSLVACCSGRGHDAGAPSQSPSRATVQQGATDNQTESKTASERAPTAAPVARRSTNKQVMPVRGQLVASFSGCVTEKRDDAQPVSVRGTRGGGAPSMTDESLRAAGVPLGLSVTHVLSHACCLTARVEGKINDGIVEVTEYLDGQPCRCMCSSTIRFTMGLDPGRYTLRLTTSDRGKRKVHPDQEFVVPEPIRAPRRAN